MSHHTNSALARDWQVLLVGGASGVGKTTVARQLARRFDVSLSQVDGYRLMLERSTTPESLPALHRYARRCVDEAVDGAELCARWIDVAREVSRALEIVVAFHAATQAPIVLEGDTLLPALATSRVLAGVPMMRRVRAVFLYESDEARLASRFAARGRGYELLSDAERRQELDRSMAYGNWLAKEAARHGCPVLVPCDGVDETTDRVITQLTA